MHTNNPTQNIVHITGYIGATPQLRDMGKGEYVANIVVYTKRSWRSGDRVIIQNDRLPLTAYGQLAHTAAKLEKGQLVQFTARLKNDRWQDRISGEWRYALRVVVTDIAVITRPATTQEEAPEASAAKDLPTQPADEEPDPEPPLSRPNHRRR